MILRLEIPVTNPALLGGVVKEWHVAEGEEIAFGDDVCTVLYDDYAVLRRTERANLLAGRKSKKLKSKLEERSGKASLEVVVSAAERAELGKVLLMPGDRFKSGDTLAVVVTEAIAGNLSPEDWAQSPPMRVVANISEDAEQF